MCPTFLTMFPRVFYLTFYLTAKVVVRWDARQSLSTKKKYLKYVNEMAKSLIIGKLTLGKRAQSIHERPRRCGDRHGYTND